MRDDDAGADVGGGAGEEVDRVPFAQYTIDRAVDEEMWGVLGRDNMGIMEWQTVHRWERPNCHFEEEAVMFGEQRGVIRTLHTPVGSLVEERIIQPTYTVEGFRKHFVEDPKDYEVLCTSSEMERCSIAMTNCGR